MELYEFLSHSKQETKGFTEKNFAPRVGMTPAKLSLIKKYKLKPTLEQVWLIHTITGGLVDGWELIRKYFDEDS